jgi:UDP-N-acetyl-D-glucosamine dehydrogenase
MSLHMSRDAFLDAPLDFAADWVRKAEHKDVVVGILGLGYVGLPLAEAFVKNGVRVVGLDIDKSKIDLINANKSYIRHISDERIAALNETGRLEVSTDFSRVPELDALLLCVPTPLGEGRQPDLRFVESTCEMIAPHMRRGQLVVLESTTWPGTCEEIMVPLLERVSGLKAHKDFAIAYSPEREDPGNPYFSTTTIPKVVGAQNDDERRMAVAMYDQITKTVPVRDLKTAEAVKLVENIYRLVNIGLVNELKHVFQKMDIDVWEVIDAAKTKPFGFAAFYPGPGLGGHCIPIDPFYLTWRAQQFGMETKFISLAGDITEALPRQTIDAVEHAMSLRLQKSLQGAKILVVGLAYKKDIDDMRESPSIHLIEILRARGAVVSYHDPFIPHTGECHDHPELANMTSVAIDSEVLAQFDCALIATDHAKVDYEKLIRGVPFVVDTRNATRSLHSHYLDKIVMA